MWPVHPEQNNLSIYVANSCYLQLSPANMFAAYNFQYQPNNWLISWVLASNIQASWHLQLWRLSKQFRVHEGVVVKTIPLGLFGWGDHLGTYPKIKLKMDNLSFVTFDNLRNMIHLWTITMFWQETVHSVWWFSEQTILWATFLRHYFKKHHILLEHLYTHLWNLMIFQIILMLFVHQLHGFFPTTGLVVILRLKVIKGQPARGRLQGFLQLGGGHHGAARGALGPIVVVAWAKRWNGPVGLIRWNQNEPLGVWLWMWNKPLAVHFSNISRKKKYWSVFCPAKNPWAFDKKTIDFDHWDPRDLWKPLLWESLDLLHPNPPHPAVPRSWGSCGLFSSHVFVCQFSIDPTPKIYCKDHPMTFGGNYQLQTTRLLRITSPGLNNWIYADLLWLKLEICWTALKR